MREIKFLGTYKKEGISRAYAYSIFECPVCEFQVEKIRKDGIKAKFCGHKCYALNRERRGAYRGNGVIISGYRYILVPEHPHATLKGYVAEHRLVAEKHLNRFLGKDEVVHHIDGNTINNCIENLLVLSADEHIKLHKKDTRRDEYGKFAI